MIFQNGVGIWRVPSMTREASDEIAWNIHETYEELDALFHRLKDMQNYKTPTSVNEQLGDQFKYTYKNLKLICS